MTRKKPDSRFPDHRGLATRGPRLVSLESFATEAQSHGRRLDEVGRAAAVDAFRTSAADSTSVEGPFGRVAVCGGVYGNYLALEALLDDARRRGAEAVYCLGDLGGFGPTPERVRPLLEQGEARCIQGNYEESLSSGNEDCNCGYTDPRDNHFAQLSYEYTARNCSDGFKDWMGRLPRRRRLLVGSRELLLVHGSPRQVNEFLFYSTTPSAFLERLLERDRCDGLLCTHTGLHWHRRLPSGRDAINVGVIGRPANDGRSNVWYTLLEARGPDLQVDSVPLPYDHSRLAREIRAEGLPEEFAETILTGWWTTCLEILPARERALSRY